MLQTRPVDRIVLIGLDGGDERWLGPWMSRGLLPNLSKIWSDSSHGKLQTSEPATTAVAWASMMTGNPPAIHGIYDDEYVRPGSGQIFKSDDRCLKSEHLWKKITATGREVISIHLPLTDAMSGLAGLIEAGRNGLTSNSQLYGSPGLMKSFRQSIPGLAQQRIWKKRPTKIEELALLVKQFQRSLDQLEAVVKKAENVVDWSVLAVNLKELDGFLHRMWPELEVDESTDALAQPQWLGLVRDSLRRVDEFIGMLAEIAGKHNAGLMLVSDHGFSRCQGLVNVNGILRIHGIQRGQGLGNRAVSEGRRSIHRARNWLWQNIIGKESGRPAHLTMRCSASKSLAFAPFGKLSGLIYLSEKASAHEGRAERLVEEISEIFRFIADPNSGDPLFSNVIPVASRWGINTHARGWPDIIAVPADGYHPVARWPGKDLASVVHFDERLPGTHARSGVIAMNGPGIEAGARIEGHVEDVAPTILKWLGLEEISQFSGKVVGNAAATNLFQPHIRLAQSRVVISTSSHAASPAVIGLEVP